MPLQARINTSMKKGLPKLLILRAGVPVIGVLLS
jgi:hypothetical protein